MDNCAEHYYIDPPTAVYAIGRADSACIWWTPKDGTLNDTVAWEIHRFRCDGGEWKFKGIVNAEALDKTQFVVRNLSENKQYKFSLKAVSDKGVGFKMSVMSNAVMVEQALPAGWFRFYSDKKKKFYYANVRTKQSSWERPEKDPYFLDQSVFMAFHEREIIHLKALYHEELEHFGSITADRFMDILYEVGNSRVPIGKLHKIFEAYAGNDSVLKSWRHYMDVLNHIKDLQINPPKSVMQATGLGRLFLYFRRQVVAVTMGQSSRKFGNWKVERNDFAGKEYYYNNKTGETSWEMPDDVRFYIPPRLNKQLLKVFDYGHLEHFKYQFCLIDVDSSGDISAGELKVVLQSMNITVSDAVLNQLVKTIDLNGNGTIEYDEFCWLMYELQKKEKSGVFKELGAFKLSNGSETVATPAASPDRMSKSLSKVSPSPLSSPKMSPSKQSDMRPSSLVYAFDEQESTAPDESLCWSPPCTAFPKGEGKLFQSPADGKHGGSNSVLISEWGMAEDLEGVGPSLAAYDMSFTESIGSQSTDNSAIHNNTDMISYFAAPMGGAPEYGLMSEEVDGEQLRDVPTAGVEARAISASMKAHARAISSSVKSRSTKLLHAIAESPTGRETVRLARRVGTAVSEGGAAVGEALNEGYMVMTDSMVSLVTVYDYSHEDHGAFCMCGCRK